MILTDNSLDRYWSEQAVFGSGSYFSNNYVVSFIPILDGVSSSSAKKSMKKEHYCVLLVYMDDNVKEIKMAPFQTTLFQTRESSHIIRS